MGDEFVAVERRRKPMAARWAWWFLGAGLAAMVAYVLVPQNIGFLISAGMSAVSVGASLVGLLRNEAPGPRRRPWYAFTTAMAIYLAGAAVRALIPGVTTNPGGLAAVLSDAVILPGYIVAGWGLLDMLRRRRGTDDRLARVDGLLVGLGAAMATWALWLAPRVEEHLYGASSLLSTLYPLADVILLVLAMHLMVADGLRKPALWMLMTSFGAIFVIDLIYAVVDTSGGLLTVFYLGSIVCYATGGAAALHPTMRSLGDPQKVITRTIGAARYISITLVVVAPTLCAYLIPTTSWWNKIGRIVLVCALAMLVNRRITRSQASQAAAEAAERHRSTHDGLTDLPNRELLTETVTRWAGEDDRDDRDSQEISLLFLDLDRFKAVNDNWGHRVGDELLGQVAGRLAAMVRAEDLVCRIGGDEFVVAMATPSHTALAESLARRIVEAFREPFPLSVNDVYITPSIGVVRAGGAPEALDLIRASDLAMYQAKDAGGNTYALYDQSLRDRAHARVRMEQALRGALGRGELSVYYQPIVRASDGAMTGFEALMRWTHPDLGFVSPDVFIPIAELTGMILVSGAWLLDVAVDQLAIWRRDRNPDLLPLHMSVNLATRQLRDPDLVAVVRRALERTGLPPDALWLEITESALLKDAEQSLATLEELRALGVKLCIDDFGTGYASLSYVKAIPASITKIDKQFIDGIGGEDGDEAIVTAVIAMAHAVNQQVVAEGVETPEQWAWLAARDCDLIQGWLFGRPQPASAQDAWSKDLLPPIQPTPAVPV